LARNLVRRSTSRISMITLPRWQVVWQVMCL
jgi:hypothetical protein